MNAYIVVFIGNITSSDCCFRMKKAFSVCISLKIEYETPCPKPWRIFITLVLFVFWWHLVVINFLEFPLSYWWRCKLYIDLENVAALRLLISFSPLTVSKYVKNSFNLHGVLNFSGSRSLGWCGRGIPSFKHLPSFLIAAAVFAT